MSATIRFTLTSEADPALVPPRYETEGAAGADLRANLGPAERQDGVLLAPMARLLVPTGLKIEIPAGFEAQIRPRSGLALKHGVTLANAPGTIDSDYRGPLGVILINLGDQSFRVCHGARIAQLVLAPVVRACFSRQDALSPSARGQGGFGSTGEE